MYNNVEAICISLQSFAVCVLPLSNPCVLTNTVYMHLVLNYEAGKFILTQYYRSDRSK